jgi:hypothetical protein
MWGDLDDDIIDSILQQADQQQKEKQRQAIRDIFEDDSALLDAVLVNQPQLHSQSESHSAVLTPEERIKQLEKQLIEKDGALSLLRSKISLGEHELLSVKSQLAELKSQEQSQRLKVEQQLSAQINALKSERQIQVGFLFGFLKGFQDMELNDLESRKSSLTKALREERRKVSRLERNIAALESNAPVKSRDTPLSLIEKPVSFAESKEGIQRDVNNQVLSELVSCSNL